MCFEGIYLYTYKTSQVELLCLYHIYIITIIQIFNSLTVLKLMTLCVTLLF